MYAWFVLNPALSRYAELNTVAVEVDYTLGVQYTLFATFDTKTRPVDGHIWKPVSSPL
jgi:hypothetical protein